MSRVTRTSVKRSLVRPASVAVLMLVCLSGIRLFAQATPGPLEVPECPFPGLKDACLTYRGTHITPGSAPKSSSVPGSPATLLFPTTPVNSLSQEIVTITNCAGCGAAIFSDFIPDVTLPNFTIRGLASAQPVGPNGALIQPCSMSLDQAANLGTDTSQVPQPRSCVIAIAFFPTSTATVTAKFGIDLMCPANARPGCEGFAYSINLIGTGGSASSGSAVTGNSTAPASSSLASAADPIDGATGQFYDTSVDLDLGGQLRLRFARYYSSALFGAGAASALGLNWMSNFDVALGVTSSTAKVLLFGGKVVTFTNSGGAWQLQSPLDTVYQFVQVGTVYKFMDPTSRLVYTFSSAGALTRWEDRNGNAITVTPGPSGPTQVSDGVGRTLTLTYTGGQLTKVVDQGARAFAYTYTGGLLSNVTDEAKKVTNYTYTTAGAFKGLLVSKQLPLGNSPTTQAYDTSGRVITQTDGNKNVTKLSYDGIGGTTITDPMGAIARQTNDSSGDLTALTDPAGTGRVTLDAAGRRLSVTDRAGNATVMSYHAPTGYLTSLTDALGNTTSRSYVAQAQDVFSYYNQTAISYPNSTSEAFTYDPHGNVLSHTAQDGTVSTSTYDANGRLLTSTNSSNAVTTYTWNADGTLATQTDPLGNQNVFGYDSLKRLNKATDPNGGVTTFFYTIAGDGSRVFVTQLAGIASTTLDSDFNGQPQDFVNPLGGVFHSVYTNTERLASSTDPLSKKTTWTYDAADQLATATDPTGVTLTYGYDAAGHMTSISDASGKLSTLTYTPEGAVASVTDATGNKISYSFDSLGRISSLTSPAGAKLAFAYDKLGKLIGTTDALGGVQTLTLDPLGRFTQRTAPGGLTTSVTRDAQGMPTALFSANGNKWRFQYDADGRVIKATDPVGNATTYTYQGTQMTQVATPLGTLSLVTDKAGHTTKRGFSDGTVVNAAFDVSGRLVSADNVSIKRDTKGQPTDINGITITLDGAGRPATLTYASGKTVTYTYNTSGRLTTIADWAGGKTQLSYDAAGRLITMANPNGTTNTYTYDANGAVVKLGFGSLGSITLTRDAAGKIISADRALPQTPSVASTTSRQFSYDAAGQLSSATSDAMGRVTSQNGRTYNWNLASQLTSFVDGANSPSFTYDGVGEINTMTTGNTTRSFVFNYLPRYPALSIVRQGGADLRYYVYLPDGTLLYSLEADNTRRVYHFDEMGNTVMLTDATGAAVDTYAITPYGEIAAHLGATDNPFTWQGQYGVFQEGTGLYNVRARHYDASAARFVSPDSVITGDPLSSEPYAYAKGNPLLWSDPFGTDSSTLLFASLLTTAVQSGKIKFDKDPLLGWSELILANNFVAAATDPKNADLDLKGVIGVVLFGNPGQTALQFQSAAKALKVILAAGAKAAAKYGISFGGADIVDDYLNDPHAKCVGLGGFQLLACNGEIDELAGVSLAPLIPGLILPDLSHASVSQLLGGDLDLGGFGDN